MALLAALAAACPGRAETASLPPATPAVRAVRVAKPAARLETGLGRATGAIRAREDATLSAKATGQIKRIRVGNLLPALFIAPLIVALAAWLGR